MSVADIDEQAEAPKIRSRSLGGDGLAFVGDGSGHGLAQEAALLGGESDVGGQGCRKPLVDWPRVVCCTERESRRGLLQSLAGYQQQVMQTCECGVEPIVVPLQGLDEMVSRKRSLVGRDQAPDDLDVCVLAAPGRRRRAQ